MARIAINVRCMAGHATGVQRYTKELVARMDGALELVAPRYWQSGPAGHLWEQFVLPGKLGKHMLWSPANSGPLTVSRQVVTMHDVSPLDHPEWTNKRFSRWYGFMMPRLARKVRRIITDSQFSKSRIVERCGVPPEKVEVVPIGVDQRFFPQTEEATSRVIDELGIPSRVYLFSLGSLEPRKNLASLLAAWRRIVDKLPDEVWLVIAGGEGVKRVFGMLDLGELPPRVHLTGYVPDEYLPALYSGAIASPYLSLYEGFGLPPLEAMACGSPVICSNTTSLPEVTGTAAWQVAPLDIEAIAQTIVEAVLDDQARRKRRELGLEQAAQFSWEECATRTLAILQEELPG